MNTPQNKEQFPGYPHYPVQDDITRPENHTTKKSLDTDANGQEDDAANYSYLDDQETIVAGTEADVTAEDLMLLDAAGQNLNTPDDLNLLASALDSTDADGEPLNEPGNIMDDAEGNDLDVPGSNLDDTDEIVGDEDEENNYYSLGGDDKEGLEENQGS